MRVAANLQQNEVEQINDEEKDTYNWGERLRRV